MRDHLGGVKIPDDRRDDVLGDIEPRVQGDQVIARELLELIHVANDVLPLGGHPEHGGGKEVVDAAPGLVQVARHLADDDPLLSIDALLGEGRVEHIVADHVDAAVHQLAGGDDVVADDGLGGVGVGVIAQFGPLSLQFLAGAGRGTLKEGVLDQVADPRAEVVVFIAAAGTDKELHGCHRRAVIFLDDERETIVEHDLLRPGSSQAGHCHQRQYKTNRQSVQSHCHHYLCLSSVSCRA